MVRVDHHPRHTDGQRVVELSLDSKIDRCLVVRWTVHGSNTGPGMGLLGARVQLASFEPPGTHRRKIAPKVQPGSKQGDPRNQLVFELLEGRKSEQLSK